MEQETLEHLFTTQFYWSVNQVIKLENIDFSNAMFFLTISHLNLFDINDYIPNPIIDFIPGQCRIRDNNIGFYINNMLYREYARL